MLNVALYGLSDDPLVSTPGGNYEETPDQTIHAYLLCHIYEIVVSYAFYY